MKIRVVVKRGTSLQNNTVLLYVNVEHLEYHIFNAINNCRSVGINNCRSQILVGGMVASWLVYSSPDRPVQVRFLAGDIVLCSLARHFTLTVPLSTQVCK